MANPRHSQSRPLEHLPPELLHRILDHCGDDFYHGRKALIDLSVMNRYLRNVATSRVFKHICFHDHAQSPGDEILHSIRRFMANPDLMWHARTVGLYLNRADSLEKPYHYLVLPELVEALVTMTDVSELYIHSEGTHGRNCLQGLEAAVHWCTGARELNIRSLTVSHRSCVSFPYAFDDIAYHLIDFLAAFPQLKALCFPGRHRFQPIIASNVTHLRLFKTCSSTLGSLRHSYGWGSSDILQLRLSQVMPNLEHLSVLGDLRGFPVSRLIEHIIDIPKLEYVDVTDEQTTQENYEYPAHWVLGDVVRHTRNHPMNEDRSELARQTFDRCAQLRRICFVRCAVGEVYLRGYRDAVADSTGYISREITDTDLGHIPGAWCQGVPQTSLFTFPSYNPWLKLGQAAQAE